MRDKEAPMASNLYVGGLSYSTTSASLRDYFGRCGTVVSATVVTDRVTGQSRGFGFVEMSTEAEAQTAIAKLDGQSFEGRRLKVSTANPQGARGGGPRSGGGNPRSGGFGPRGGGFGSAGGFGGGRRQARW
jgi:RNA recognition motif-containing protein